MGVHGHPDGIHSAASAIRHQADAVDQARRDSAGLASQITDGSGAWRGHGGPAFSRLMQGFDRDFGTISQSFHQLADALDKYADKLQEAINKENTAKEVGLLGVVLTITAAAQLGLDPINDGAAAAADAGSVAAIAAVEIIVEEASTMILFELEGIGQFVLVTETSVVGLSVEFSLAEGNLAALATSAATTAELSALQKVLYSALVNAVAGAGGNLAQQIINHLMTGEPIRPVEVAITGGTSAAFGAGGAALGAGPVAGIILGAFGNGTNDALVQLEQQGGDVSKIRINEVVLETVYGGVTGPTVDHVAGGSPGAGGIRRGAGAGGVFQATDLVKGLLPEAGEVTLETDKLPPEIKQMVEAQGLKLGPTVTISVNRIDSTVAAQLNSITGYNPTPIPTPHGAG